MTSTTSSTTSTAANATTNASTTTLDYYLTLVPRGLQDIVQEALPQQIREASSSSTNGQDDEKITVIVQGPDVIGEDPLHYNSAHLQELRNRIVAAFKKKQQKRKRMEHPQLASTRLPIGSVQDDSSRTGRHVSLGYDEQNDALWSIPGGNVGAVWLRFKTNATPQAVASCRCIGPLLALVHAYTTPITSCDNGKNDNSDGIQLLEELRREMETVDWEKPLNLWKRHLRHDDDDVDTVSFHNSDPPFQYRCSCVRDESKSNLVPRQELLRQGAGFITPPQLLPASGSNAKVSLTKFDMELVWFIRPHASAVAISLRRNPGTVSSFESGQALPPDITPPYVHNDNFAVRLRPTTAQLLLHMARLQDGDVVLDPCVGIGTIVMECLHLRRPEHVVAMGGDLELADALRTTAADYEAQTRQFLQQQQQQHRLIRHQAMLCAWDSVDLPLATASVDVIVSDLPFGQTCLSSFRLTQLVPLLLDSWARVLKPAPTGRMVLLCGNPHLLLEGMQQANQELHEAISISNSSNKNAAESSSSGSPSGSVAVAPLWELPVSSCRPVNIGGHQGWIVVVRRGTGSHREVGRLSSCLSKYIAKRDQRRSLPQR